MDKYEIQKQIGDGTYGTVARAVHKKTGQTVAIKRMKQKYYSWDECIKLPEVQALRKLHAHPNVIKLKEVLRERNELFFVFEFMDGDLLGVIRAAKANPPLNPQSPMMPHTKVRAIMYQMFQSLAHLHKCGYFHRDLKPENMLIKKDPTNPNAFDIVKLADFGLVKEIRAKPPFTDYVSTRWYRGPELLLQDRTYSSPVDMWAAGCIMVELMSTRPLFPGSNELDQLFRIISVFGPPTEKSWPEGCAMARKLRYTFPNPAVTPLRKMVPPHTPPNAFDLIERLLVYDPRKRLSAAQALQHPYFTVGGIGLDGPLAFQQPLETAGIMRPQNTSSAPPSQLSGTGAMGGLMSPQNTKPGSADRPLMPPVHISRAPPPLPNATVSSQNGIGVSSLKSPQGSLPSALPSATGGGYGGQYHINQKPPSALGGTIGNDRSSIRPVGGFSSPSPLPHSGANSFNNTLNSIARPPTKIESTSSATNPSPHPPGGHLAPLGNSHGLGGSSSASGLQQHRGSIPNMASTQQRSSLAAGNDDLDDLLEEFSKGVERDSKSTNAALFGGGAQQQPPKVAPLKGLSPIPGGSASSLSRPAGGILPTLNSNATQSQIDESPLQKLLNSARYRNADAAPSGGAYGARGNSLSSMPGNDNVLHPTSTFSNRPAQLSSTPLEGRRKVVPATTQLTTNVGPLIGKLSSLSPGAEPSWLQ